MQSYCSVYCCFWVTVCKTVRHMLSDHCPVCLSVCNVGALWGTAVTAPHGCMYQDATWYGGRPRPRRLCIRWRPRSPSPKRGQTPQIFGPCLLWPNGRMDQDGNWHKNRPQPRQSLSPGDFVLDGDPAPLSHKGVEPPIFRPTFIVATIVISLEYCTVVIGLFKFEFAAM